MIHLDTHVAVWLYTGDFHRLPDELRRRLESESLAISPMVRLELTYLHEVGRLRHHSSQVLDELRRAIGLEVDTASFADVVAVAASERLAFTRDPFDRIIGAQAMVASAALATKDETLLAHLEVAVWG